MYLSTITAYYVMIIFLENIYMQNNSDDLGGLLGDLPLLMDGTSVDPAAIYDWCLAVGLIKQKDGGLKAVELEEIITYVEAYDALCVFLQEYSNRTSSPAEIDDLIQNLIQAKKELVKNNPLILLWDQIVDFVQKNPVASRERVAFKLLK